MLQGCSVHTILKKIHATNTTLYIKDTVTHVIVQVYTAEILFCNSNNYYYDIVLCIEHLLTIDCY